MIRLKLILRTMLSMPVLREVQAHYLIIFGVLAYLGLLFLVLKAFQYNKDKFEN